MRAIQADFTHLERWALRELARRIRENKTIRLTDGSWDGVAFEERNYKGLKGAYAVARLLGVDFDRAIYGGQDPGFDLVYRGMRVEVKHLQKWLAFNSPAHFKADAAVLVNPIPNSESVIVLGCVTGEDFFKRCFKADFGYGERFCLKPEDLHEIALLDELAAQKAAA